MSLNHPYLKQLKVHVIRFCQQNNFIRDDHPSLLPFCRTLEDILQHGLVPRTLSNSFKTGLAIRTYWQWIQWLGDNLPVQKLTLPVQFCVTYVLKCKQIYNDRGRGRLFLRLCLNKCILKHVLRLLRDQNHLLMEYYDPVSILGSDILSEIFISMLEPLNQCRFALNVKNCSFLDESWELPLYRRYELVPCKVLGVSLQRVDTRLVVVEVKSGSVADEDAKIEPGDAIDELFSEALRDCPARKFGSVMSQYQGSPIYITVIKCCFNDGSIFRPLLPYLESLNLSHHHLSVNHMKRIQEIGLDKADQLDWTNKEKLVTDTGEYPVKYIGEVGVGPIGTVEKIEDAVMQVLDKQLTKRDVYIKLGDTDIQVTCQETDTLVLQHGFPEIGSCGRRVDHPLNFAYIAGETTCTIAKDFTCYVFEAITDEQSKGILQGIAQGFNRTHWAV